MEDGVGSLRNLVLLHGWATDGRIWDNQRAALEDRANVWAPDLPVWEAAWLVEKLSRTFDPAQTVLVGWSLGGMLALEVCAAGFRPRTLITISTCASFCRRPDYGLGVLTAVVRGMRQRLRLEPTPVVQEDFIASFWPSGKDNGRKACRTCCLKTWIHSGWPRDWSICRRQDLRPVLPDVVAKNMVIVHGQRDRIAAAAQAYFLRDQLPAARLVLVPGTGHVPMVTRSRDINELMAEFL